MKKITFLIAVMALCIPAINAQADFAWETAVLSADETETTETINGITLTVTNDVGSVADRKLEIEVPIERLPFFTKVK